jgi:predicted AlkP superfamily pyrophosphatase or phosphodiesterase
MKARGSVLARLTTVAVTAITLAVAACARGPGRAVPTGEQSVVLISIDGFKPEYLDRYAPPHLTALAASGVRARWMTPVMPTLTFPNHYTIATGLYPAHHGVVNNRFTDPADGARFLYTDSLHVRQSRWWGGEPIWVTAEKQGARAGVFFWVGSEAAIQGVRPTFWRKYDDRVPGAARADSLVAWLTRADSLRVRIGLLYFDAVDDLSHDSGPGHPATGAAVMAVDSAIGRLIGGLREQGLEHRVNIIVVSDHGQAPTSPQRIVYLDDYLDVSAYDAPSVTPFLAVTPRNGDVAAGLAAWRRVPHLTVYPRDSTPAWWRYRGNPRIPPILGVWDEGWLGGTREYYARRPPKAHGGDHGYAADLESMRALFIASGPAFRRGAVVEPFANVHVYNLLCAILGVRPSPNDGSPDSVLTLLR